VLVLTRDGNGTTLHGRGRDIEEIKDAAVFERETCLWRIVGKAADVRRSDERATIVAVLKEATEPLSPREIADLSGHPYNAVRMMLTRMVKASEVKHAGRGRYEYSHPPVTTVTTLQTTKKRRARSDGGCNSRSRRGYKRAPPDSPHE